MLNLPLWTLLVILAALLACGEQTPTQGGAVATVPATAEGPTSLPSPVTPAAEPTETPQTVPTETSGPGAATTPLPVNTPAPEATSEPTQAPAASTPVPTLESETPTPGHKLASTPTTTPSTLWPPPRRQPRLHRRPRPGDPGATPTRDPATATPTSTPKMETRVTAQHLPSLPSKMSPNWSRTHRTDQPATNCLSTPPIGSHPTCFRRPATGLR